MDGRATPGTRLPRTPLSAPTALAASAFPAEVLLTRSPTGVASVVGASWAVAFSTSDWRASESFTLTCVRPPVLSAVNASGLPVTLAPPQAGDTPTAGSERMSGPASFDRAAPRAVSSGDRAQLVPPGASVSRKRATDRVAGDRSVP